VPVPSFDPAPALRAAVVLVRPADGIALQQLAAAGLRHAAMTGAVGTAASARAGRGHRQPAQNTPSAGLADAIGSRPTSALILVIVRSASTAGHRGEPVSALPSRVAKDAVLEAAGEYHLAETLMEKIKAA